jgi:hypothetical protein
MPAFNYEILANLKNLLSKIKEGGEGSQAQVKEFLSSEDNRSKYQELVDELKNNPNSRAELNQMLRDKASSRFAKQLGPFLKGALNGVDLAISLNQIAKSNKTLGSIIQPAIAQSPGIPPELQSQLSMAQNQGGLEAQRAVATAKATNQEQLLNDINTAKQVSGGQGAAYQANVQSASLRNQRANAVLPAQQDAIRARYQQMANQLAESKGQLGQHDFGNRLYASQLALEQYNKQLQAAGALGQAGRLNLRNSLQNSANIIPDILGQSMYPDRVPANTSAYSKGSAYATNIPKVSSLPAPVSDWETKFNDNFNKTMTARSILNKLSTNPSYLPY